MARRRRLRSHLWSADTLKSLTALVIAVGGIIGVRHESGVKNAEAVDGSRAAASVAVQTAIRVDSLEARLERQERAVRALRRANADPSARVEPYGPPVPPRRHKFLGIF